MAFKSDRQRKAAFANMNRGTYPESPPQGMILTDSRQKTIGGEIYATELPKKSPRRIQPIEMSTEKQGNMQVMLRKDRVKPIYKSSSPEAAAKYVKDMEELDREFGVVLHLDTKNNIVGKEVVSMGSLNAAVVHPREVFKGAILNNSAGIIFVHNHPSGDPAPSQNDLDITRKLKDTGRMTGIELMDSIVIGHDGRFVSLRESNLGGF